MERAIKKSIIGLTVGLDKICFFFFYFAFLLYSINLPILLFRFTHFAIHPFCFPKIPFLHTVIKVQAKIRESNEQGCSAT